jgi:hypothetical protein
VTISGLVCFNVLAFLSFFVAFFVAMFFLLASDCPTGAATLIGNSRANVNS